MFFDVCLTRAWRGAQLEWRSDAEGNITEVMNEIDPLDAAEAAASEVVVNYNTGGFICSTSAAA